MHLLERGILAPQSVLDALANWYPDDSYWLAHRLSRGDIPELSFLWDRFDIVAAWLSNLTAARREFEAHVDYETHGYPFDGTIRRLHIPIKTNPDVFMIETGRKPQHWEVGNLYEMNPLKEHSVINGGDEDRVHLILDVKNAVA